MLRAWLFSNRQPFGVPTDKKADFTLVDMVNQQYPDRSPLLPAHRLDRDTTGVILFAKGKQNQERLMQLFKEKKVHKAYIGFVHGRVEKLKAASVFPLRIFISVVFAKTFTCAISLDGIQGRRLL